MGRRLKLSGIERRSVIDKKGNVTGTEYHRRYIDKATGKPVWIKSSDVFKKS